MHGLFRPRKNILGSELAGEVESLGREVWSFKAGDRVFGLSGTRLGAHAEYVEATKYVETGVKTGNVVITVVSPRQEH